MANNNQAQNDNFKLSAIARGAENFLRWSSSAMLRGGRVTKVKGEVASYSPELGLVSHGARLDLAAGGGSATLTLGLARRLLRWSAAPVALFAAGAPAFAPAYAQAQDACVEVNPSEFVCEDNGDPATSEQFFIPYGDSVTLTLEDGFDIDTSGILASGIGIAYADDVIITQQSGSSTITGARYGINVYLGYGSIDITTGGDVTGVILDGVYASNVYANGLDASVHIDSTAGTVTGNENGIDARNFGGGSLSITTADVVGQNNNAIEAQNNGSDLSIDSSAGAVSGGVHGIYARNNGTGTLSITTANVTAQSGNGVEAINDVDGEDVIIDTTDGGVTGSDNGIYARQNGTGDTIITTEDVDGEGGNGIDAVNAATAGDLTIDSSAGSVFGQYSGIVARNQGNGATTIITADVDTGPGEIGTRDGINAYNASSATDLVIDSSAGSITGQINAIVARNNGTGNTIITTGDVDGEGGDGIDAENASTAGDLTIDSSAGSVTGQVDGIDALNTGSGVVNVVTGDVTGRTGDGVDVAGNANVSAILVDTSAGTVRGAQYGVNVANFGYGAVTVITGNVTATNRDGIDVSDDGENGAGFDGTDVTIDSSAGSVTGGQRGIDALNVDTGNLTIITGDVTGLSNNGIQATNRGGTGDLVIDSSAGAVTGAGAGISATNVGTGDTVVTTGDVRGNTESGVDVAANFGTGDLIVDTSAGTVSNGAASTDNTINIINLGDGITRVITADVTGESDTGEGAGVYAGSLNLTTSMEIDTTAGTVNASGDGIQARHEGSGDLDIRTGAVTSRYGDGIDAINQDTGNLTINSSSGAVSGATNGIYARQNGTGTLSITTASVTGQSGNGVDAVNDVDGEDIILDTTDGAVIGSDNGIYARQNGTGNTTITTGDVDGETGNGIDAENAATAGDLIIDSSAGSVVAGPYSYSDAIRAVNEGTGITRITTADVTSGDGTGEGGAGINVYSGGDTTGLEVDTSAGTVNGDTSGIRAVKVGPGDVSIVTADVVGNFGDGIYAYTGEGGLGALSIDSSAGSVSATGGDGIDVTNVTANSVSITTADITAVADSSGEGGNGINLDHQFSEAQTVTIDTTSGSVTADSYGINVVTRGHDLLSITTADVAGGSDGIRVIANEPEAGNIVIDSSAGSVTSQDNSGIFAQQFGSGDLSITTADVSGREFGTQGSGYGIFADSTGGSITINSVAGDLSGAQGGIFARVNGSGGISITAANVTSTGLTGINASLVNTDGDATIDTSAGAVSGQFDGINLNNDGSGSSFITTGDVTGLSGDGIDLYGGERGEGILSVDSTAGSVVGGDNGIVVTDDGGTEISITTAAVTGQGGNGIRVNGQNSGTRDITVDSSAGAVSGASNGIFARNDGAGSTSITTGDVTGLGSYGIDVRNEGVDLIINSVAGSVFGTEGGILANNSGTGTISVTTADVSAQNDDAINVLSGVNTTVFEIDTTAGAILGDRGIVATHQGSHDFTIITANVTGTGGDGISATNTGLGTGNLTIDTSAGVVSGGANGITGSNQGTGSTTIITADVTGLGASDDGIDFDNGATTTGLLIDTTSGSVTGGDNAISVGNEGNGLVTIRTADVTGIDGKGIELGNLAGDVVIDSRAGTVRGEYGVFVQNEASGSLTISTADVIGEEYGIYAYNNAADATDLTVDTSAGSVTAEGVGIFIENEGTGQTVITTSDVTADAGNGIDATTFGADLTIDTSAGAVSGGISGINVRNDGTGLISVVTGDVTGDDLYGILAVNGAVAGNITIDSTAGTVTSGDRGIAVFNNGTGAISVTSGDVDAGLGGIHAINRASGTDVTIDSTAGTVTSVDTGVLTTNEGTGDTLVTTANISSQSDGIFAQNQIGSGSLTIDSRQGTVSGGDDGIVVSNYGSGATTITTADVSGQDGIRVLNRASAGNLAIDTSSGAVTGTANGIIVDNISGGVTRITTANVSAIGGGDGIYAAVANGAVIDTTAGSVTAGVRGIEVRNGSAGDVSITTADVSGDFEAINVVNSGGSVTIDTAAGTADGAIRVDQNGSGNTAVTTGDVMSDSSGVFVRNAAGSGGLTIDTSAGSVTAGNDGIYASHSGTGATSVRTANVTGATGDGVIMVTGADATTLDIDTSDGAVVGGNRGIFANHGGSDDLTITVGNVTGQGAEGILASTNQIGADIFVNGVEGVASNVIGATNGIGLTTQGANITVNGLDSVTGQAGDGLNLVSNGGNISVNDIGTITGIGGNGIFANADSGNITIDNVGFDGGITATGGVGIAAYADNGGTITIGTSGPVSGDTYGVEGDANNGGDVIINTTNYDVTGAIGIRAINEGVGIVSVTTANVTGTGGEGILAESNGGDLTVDTVAGAVSGLTDGIIATHNGTGSTTITTGDVTATTATGILANIGANANGLVIDTTAGDVTAGGNGIFVSSASAGVTTITAGDIDAQSNAIVALTDADLTVDTTAGTVTSGQGIIANAGAGSTTVTTANVDSTQGNGIFAQSSDGDLSVDSSAGSVSAQSTGIIANNFGTGATTIITGDVRSQTSEGINAYVDATGGDLTIDTSAGSVSGGTRGIYSRNLGSGNTSITTASVSGGLAGIVAFQGGDTGDLTVDSSGGAVLGGEDGIDLNHSGTGDLTVTTGDVTGENGIGIAVSGGADTGNITVDSSAGSVAGASLGITVGNSGAGDTTITTADVTAIGLFGINAYNFEDDGGAITIDTTAGAVTGQLVGVRSYNNGIGVTTITTGDVTGTGNFGVQARSNGALIIDTSAGNVTGGQTGIRARADDAGSISIVAANVAGNTAGIDAANVSEDSGDLIIDSSAGAVSGDDSGVRALNQGAGVTSVTTADVSANGESGIGVNVRAYGTDVLVNTVEGDVVGGEYSSAGILVVNNGTGLTDIVTGNVSSVNGDAVNAVAYGTDLVIDTSAGTVTGGEDGIDLNHSGTGDVTVTTADVTGENGIGIATYTSGTLLSIDTTAGDVTGGNAGINVLSFDDEVSIVTGDVTGESGDGIRVVAGGTTISIDTSAGVVSGGDRGIEAFNYGGAQVLSVVTGDVTGESRNGIYASDVTDGAGEGGDILVDSSAGTVAGGTDGIRVVNVATGDVEIVTGTVTGNVAGINAANLDEEGGDLTIDSAAGEVRGKLSGIVAANQGSGSVSIIAANVIGNQGHGIDASNAGENLVIDTSAGSVMSTAQAAPSVPTMPAAPMPVNSDPAPAPQSLAAAADAVSSEDADMVETPAQVSQEAAAQAQASAQAPAMIAGAVAATDNASDEYIATASHMAGSDTPSDAPATLATKAPQEVAGESVAVGAVPADEPAAYVAGIVGAQPETAGSAAKTAGNIGHSNNAANAAEQVVPDMASAAAPADVSTSAISAADDAADDAGAVEVASATDAPEPVSAPAASPDTAPTQIADGSANAGLSSATDFASRDVLITDGVGTSDAGSIEAVSEPGAELSPEANPEPNLAPAQLAAAASTDGENAVNGETRGGNGINAVNLGTGFTSIVTADVTSNAGMGIYAVNMGTDLTVDTDLGAVAGAQDGIVAANMGSGVLSLITADVSSDEGSGIYAMGEGTDLVVDTAAGSVTGAVRGIGAFNQGSGETRITTGDVTGLANDGVAVQGQGTSIAVDTLSGSVQAARTGITADQRGSGALTIATGSVSGTMGDGVYAVSSNGEIAIDTAAGSITGGDDGVHTVNGGVGALAIVTADVQGFGDAGIKAIGSAGALSIDSSAGTVIGNNAGIIADQQSADMLFLTVDEVMGAIGIDAQAAAGSTAITLAQTANVIGTTGAGVEATSSGGDIAVQGSSGTISGATDGVLARSEGGDISVDSLDLVAGGTGQALNLGSLAEAI